MKRLDEKSLERIAEIISLHGSNPDDWYAAPLDTGDILAFFGRAGVRPRGKSYDGMPFVFESLVAFNSEPSGELVSSSLEKVLLRYASPKEHAGHKDVIEAEIVKLNEVLWAEGLEIVLEGTGPRLREKVPDSQPASKKQSHHTPAPDFARLVADTNLARILTLRWEEAQQCMNAGACLSAVIMMGSILEGVLFSKAMQNQAIANQASSAPRDRKTGKPKPLEEWGLNVLINVAHDVGWLHIDVKKFSQSLCESRNFVHPREQLRSNFTPDAGTCAMCWPVVIEAINDLLRTAP